MPPRFRPAAEVGPYLLARVTCFEPCRPRFSRQIRSHRESSWLSETLRVKPDPQPNPSQSFSDLPRDAVPNADERLRASEERFRLLIESATEYAIFTTDPNRIVNYWNSGAERVFGWSETEILGQTADIIFTAEDRAAGMPEREVRIAVEKGRAQDERWHMRKDGSRFFASGVMMTMRSPSGALQGFVKIARDLTERKLAQDALEARVRERTSELQALNEVLHGEIQQRVAAERERQDVLRRITTAQEDERLRISRELHDQIGQHLAALMLGLNSLEPILHGTAGVEILKQLQSLTENIGHEVHGIAVQLRPTVLDDLGLNRAITTYVQFWADRTGIAAELHTAGLENPRLPQELELALFRIVQEALTNIVRHAAAKRASVIVERHGTEVAAVIEDDGSGFEVDATKQRSRTGLGLLGINERARLLGGRANVESQPGAGTTVFVRIPIPA